MTDTEHFVFLLMPEFSHLAFANAVEPLRIANLVSGLRLYDWSFASADGQTAAASNGSLTVVHHAQNGLPACDRLFVLSGVNVRSHVTPALRAALRRARVRGVPLGALCSGAYALAMMGLLDGMRVAIHWDWHDGFIEEFPDVALERSVFVADAPIISASGGSATADLMLHLIARTHGEALSVTVADQMVYTTVRSATAEQRTSLQARAGARSPRLAQAIAIMRASVECPMPTPEIGAKVGVSARQLERLFGKHLGTTPKKYMLGLRLERARALLVQTEMSVVEIALACGFENAGHFARVYRSAYGVSPARQRARLD